MFGTVHTDSIWLCSYAGQDIQLLVKTPLIIHQSAYTTHHTPLVIHHSSYTTQHTPLIIHHSSYTPHHTRLIIHSLRVHDRSYIQIRIPFSPMCGMQGLPPLKNTVQVQVKYGIDASPLPFLCQTPLRKQVVVDIVLAGTALNFHLQMPSWFNTPLWAADLVVAKIRPTTLL